MSFMAPIALTIPGRRDPNSLFLLKIYSMLMKGVFFWGGGVINIWPVKLSETVTVIKR